MGMTFRVPFPKPGHPTYLVFQKQREEVFLRMNYDSSSGQPTPPDQQAWVPGISARGPALGQQVAGQG